MCQKCRTNVKTHQIACKDIETLVHPHSVVDKTLGSWPTKLVGKLQLRDQGASRVHKSWWARDCSERAQSMSINRVILLSYR